MAPGKFESNFKWIIFKLILAIDGWGISFEIALRRMSADLTNDKSIVVQVIARCHQATSHYLNQYWPSSMSPYGVTRSQRNLFLVSRNPRSAVSPPGGMLKATSCGRNCRDLRLVITTARKPSGRLFPCLYAPFVRLYCIVDQTGVQC